MASHASCFPSAEKVGRVSQALLSAVRLRGGAEASTGARNKSKLVDHASSRPASRAVNTIDLPSGVNVNSSPPPNGFDGESASMASITSTGVPPTAGITNTCERRPSDQVSQWRMKRVSYTRPDALLAARSASFFALSSIDVPGNTSAENAICCPSRATTMFDASTPSLVTCIASPPSNGIFQICDEPERVDVNQIHLPSADQRPPVSLAGLLVSWRGAPPSLPTIQRSVRPLFASRSLVRSVKRTHFPSGETCGSEIRFIAHMSLTPKG